MLQTELDVLKSEWTQNDDVLAILEGCLADAHAAFDKLPDEVAPQVVGVTVPEAANRMRAAVDAAMTRLNSGESARGTPQT